MLLCCLLTRWSLYMRAQQHKHVTTTHFLFRPYCYTIFLVSDTCIYHSSSHFDYISLCYLVDTATSSCIGRSLAQQGMYPKPTIVDVESYGLLGLGFFLLAFVTVIWHWPHSQSFASQISFVAYSSLLPTNSIMLLKTRFCEVLSSKQL